MRRKLALAAAFAGVAVLGVLVTGCGGAHRAVPVVSVTERDFTIRAPRVFPRGDLRLVLRNEGPVSHELLIVRASRNRLPLRADGFTIDEDSLHQRLVAAIEPQAPGKQSSVLLHLVPGHYHLLCNMSGHAAGGMLVSFQVR
jgi:Sulfocyanin (SoxE) domain